MSSSNLEGSSSELPVFDPDGIVRLAVDALREPVAVVRHAEGANYGLARAGTCEDLEQIALLPPVYPEWLGDRTFGETHGTRFPYVGGAMARGIASVDYVVALGRHGMLGFFGAAGLSMERLEASLREIGSALAPLGAPWGANLIHSPQAGGREEAVVDLYLKCGVNRVSASAFMKLSPSVVRYACSGLQRDAAGHPLRRNFVFAKLSRPEVAQAFLSPPPSAMLQALVAAGKITATEAEIAASLPVAEDITVESDSGGHTDNRPLASLFPVVRRLANELSQKYGYARPIRVGAAGGLGTPQSLAAAFALGASYVLLGSVHQCTVEADLAADAKAMLTQAGVADVAMTASADMFEAGVKVQVLRRGTLMASRGNRLYALYKRYASLEAIPTAEREDLEKTVLGIGVDAIWEQTRAYFEKVDPAQLARAESDAKLRMALVFRWYLGNSSRWPIEGDTARRSDYQIWCGPAMGAFNDWVRGSFLEPLENRHVGQIGLNLMEGAAQLARLQQLRSAGLPLAGGAFTAAPRLLSL